MQSYKDFFIDYVASYGYGPPDYEYIDYLERLVGEEDACNHVSEGYYGQTSR